VFWKIVMSRREHFCFQPAAKLFSAVRPNYEAPEFIYWLRAGAGERKSKSPGEGRCKILWRQLCLYSFAMHFSRKSGGEGETGKKYIKVYTFFGGIKRESTGGEAFVPSAAIKAVKEGAAERSAPLWTKKMRQNAAAREK